MKSTFKILGIIAIVAIIGFSMAACDNNEELDTWTDITSLFQLNGTWKYSEVDKSRTHLEDPEDDTINESVASWFLFCSANSASAGTMAGSYIITYTYSGSIIDYLWPLYKEWFFVGKGWTIDDTNHSVTSTVTVPPSPISLSDVSDMAMQINQNGIKLKMNYNFEGQIFIKQ